MTHQECPRLDHRKPKLLTIQNTVCFAAVDCSSVQFKRVSMHEIEKAILCSIMCLTTFPRTANKTVSMLVWFLMALSHPPKQNHQSCALLGFVSAGNDSSSSTFHIFWDLTVKPPAKAALPASLPSSPFPLTLAYPGQYIHSFQRWMSNTDTFQSASCTIVHILYKLIESTRQSSRQQAWLLSVSLSNWTYRPYRLHCTGEQG